MSPAPTLLKFRAGHVTTIPTAENEPKRVHVWDDASILAVNAATAAARPLLVRGEPGVGKSQLARATAVELGREFVMETVNLRTEPDDLLWRFDAVARLAEAQLQGALPQEGTRDVERCLDLRNFVRPGLLWWALSWHTAQEVSKTERPPSHAAADPGNGVIALIDEIDKADSSVPNSLLQALGDRRFRPPGWPHDIESEGAAPLVFITTNEDRSLPNAFLRRCLVLFLELERGDGLIGQLMTRGRQHFNEDEIDDGVLEEAAKQLSDDRSRIQRLGLSAPGQAEYLDLLRALHEQTKTGGAQRRVDQLELLERIRKFVFHKHPEETTE